MTWAPLLLVVAIIAFVLIIATRPPRAGDRCACGEPLDKGEWECGRCWWDRQAP